MSPAPASAKMFRVKQSAPSSSLILPPAQRAGITGLVLAGGEGRRMGGVDKGLQLKDGKPLAQHAIERLAPQVGNLLLSANRNAAAYAAFGWPVLADEVNGFAGPLAGLYTGLGKATTPWLVSVPCDSPAFPPDLVFRLFSALAAGNGDIAIARTAERVHPVFCLCRTILRASLGDYLARGERRFMAWTAQQACVEVLFAEGEAAFANVNTLAEL